MLGLLIFGCSQQKEPVGSKYVGGGPYPEPTFKTDQRVVNYSISRTTPTGAVGPGSGGSYAGYNYRNSALKSIHDTTFTGIEDSSNENSF
jgi:hypothetical protein